MITKVLNIIIFFLLLHQSGNTQGYNFIKYNVQEGLPQSQVYDLYQDSKSYLWMATQGGGVTRFDGDNFETISTRDGLPSNYVQTIFEDAENNLWFGTKTGLCQYDHKEITWTKKNELIVYSITERADSSLWLGTQAGIYQFDKKAKTFSKLKLRPALDIARVNEFYKKDDQLWLSTSRGLFVEENGKMSLYGLNKGLLSEDIKSVTSDKDGNMWIVQFAGGVSCMHPKTKEILVEYNQSNIRRGQDIYIDENNQKWISTQNKGIHIYNPKDTTWTAITEAEGLAHNNVHSVFKDSWGNIWIATSGGGVNKFIGQFFTHYNSTNGLDADRVYAIKEDAKGTLWVSVANDGITTIDSSGFQIDIDSAYITTKCNHIFEDREERIWLSTAGGGLVLKDTIGFRVFTQFDGLPSDWIKTTIQDTLGNIWLGSYANGLGKIMAVDSVGLQTQIFTQAQGLPDLFITALAKDPDGKIWFATKQGAVGYIENDRIRSFSKTNGLPKVSIRSIVFDSFKNVWVGTAGDGIFTASYTDKDLQFTKMEKSESLSSENIYLLIFDQAANLWAGSEIGLDKIILNNSGVVTEVQHFGKNEGFLGIETCHNAATIDDNGNIWFGTLNGLTKHKPSNTERSISKPKIHFTNIDLMHQSIEMTEYAHLLNQADSLNGNSHFKYNQNDIGFNFKAINVDYPNDFAYVWKLEGLDDNWSQNSKAESVKYTNLPPNDYQFKVKAVGKGGLDSPTISTSFTIKPAFWQERWFQLLMLLLLGLLAYIIFSTRVAKIEKREAAKRAKLELENELLGLEQKALQLQMNPHFIFNALNSIQSLVVNKKNDIARDQIQNFATLMRGILSNSKKTRISLQEEFLTLDKYLKIEKFCQAVPFDYEIILPKGYDPEEVEIPPMMIQPFVENAVFHGISHLNKAGKITVQFDIEKELLSCSISDNGVGREKSKAVNATRKKGHQSTAINVTKQRLEALRNGQSYNHFSITDISNEAGEVKGTKVVLTMPLEVNF